VYKKGRVAGGGVVQGNYMGRYARNDAGMGWRVGKWKGKLYHYIIIRRDNSESC